MIFFRSWITLNFPLTKRREKNHKILLFYFLSHLFKMEFVCIITFYISFINISAIFCGEASFSTYFFFSFFYFLLPVCAFIFLLQPQ